MAYAMPQRYDKLYVWWPSYSLKWLKYRKRRSFMSWCQNSSHKRKFKLCKGIIVLYYPISNRESLDLFNKTCNRLLGDTQRNSFIIEINRLMSMGSKDLLHRNEKKCNILCEKYFRVFYEPACYVTSKGKKKTNSNLDCIHRNNAGSR